MIEKIKKKEKVKPPISSFNEDSETIKLKIKTIEKKIAETEKKMVENGVTLVDSKEIFVPLNDEEKYMVSLWRERSKKVPKSPVVFTYTNDAEGNRTGSIQTIDGYPTSPIDKLDVWNAAINLATGAINHDFGYLLFKACYTSSGVVKNDKNEGKDLTALINAMQAFKPEDEVEGMLVSKLICLHFQSMKYLSYLNTEGLSSNEVDSNINRSTKLSRLYNETLEALMRYRRKGEQRVVVQHVQINDGGKAAIVGNMIGGGVNDKNNEVPYEYTTDL